ncbi:MAG: hypothetical protein LBU16_00240 [Treponema sp.]|nr:hypothetical protein [Treponema sp.]
MSLFQNPMVFPQAYNKIMGIHEGLGYIDKLKKELDGHRPLSKELAIGLKQLLDVDFTYNSNLSIM